MKNSSKIFYIKAFSILNGENIDLSDIPMLVRRKMSSLDKVAMASVGEVYEDGVEEVIFASRYGELDRLKSIIESYLACNEASPAKFSASVHNFFAGFLCQQKCLTVSYHSLSAGENTLSAGLVKSIISSKSKVLFCFGESVPEMRSVACLISSVGGENFVKCKFEKVDCELEVDEFASIEKFFYGEIKSFRTTCGLIERMED